ncbi:galactose oxidase [Phellopilus nigrolimitatus]|nr:galactose oxidase [Phellopilus nigrolimitatus]
MYLHDAEPAPPTLMYWSRAPVWGALPTHKMRSHSATVVDNTTIWLFGGCDDKEFWRDVLCLDVETMECTRPETIGDIPPPCRAHTATLVERRLFVFGGGQGNMYYNTLYILDTVSRRWTHISFSDAATSTSNTSHMHTLSGSASDAARPAPAIAAVASAGAPEPPDAEEDALPRPRRAHTTVLYKGRLVVFGGGNGAMALNDVWVLDTGVPPERMRWARQRTTGGRPSPRGYHTANLVGSVMLVVGGSDGRQTFADIFCLNLDTWHWSAVHTDRTHRRLAHTATQIGSYLFIMGGHDGSQYTNDLLLFNLVSLQYEPRPTRGGPPSARGYHAAALADGRLWVFGGYDGRSAHDDVHMLDLASSAYLSQVTGFYVNVE